MTNAYRTGYRESNSHIGVHFRFDINDRPPVFPAGMVRLMDRTFHWETLNPQKGVYNFREMNSALYEMDNKYEPVFVFFRTPRWCSTKPDEPLPSENNPGACAPPDYRAVKTFLTELNKSFPYLKYFEFWNEPWSEKHWSGTEEEFWKFHKVFYQTVHRLWPQAVVISSADNYDTAENDRVNKFDRYLQACASFIDVVGIHLYEPTYTRMVSSIKSFKEIISKHGLDNRPLWCTEFGVKNMDKKTESESASEIVRSFLTMQKMGIDKAFLFACDDPDYNINTPLVIGSVEAMP